LDYCSASPDRLFPSGLLPTQNTDYAIEELRRVAKMGFKAGLVRPVICNDRYPTFPEFDPLWREFEELGLTLGMHTFIPGGEPMTAEIGKRIAGAMAGGAGLFAEGAPMQVQEFLGTPTGSDQSLVYSPGQWVDNILRCMGCTEPGLEALSFVMEAMNWTMVVLLSGWLEKFPKLKVAILESNATWLPLVLEKAEGYLELDKWMRDTATPPVKTGDPREVFNSKCFISFESDEDMVFRAWDFYEDIALWSSDMPHHDGADVWDAIDGMNKRGVPQEAQEKMLGGNARRLYGIEPKLYVTEAPAEYVPEKLPRYGVGAEA
jgi:predicted TIM-barrel fold metal-dependent hydrolase